MALAALMPIVAGIGGNSGNQTITMIVRHGDGPGQHRQRTAAAQEGARRGALQWRGGAACWGLLAWWLYGAWTLVW